MYRRDFVKKALWAGAATLLPVGWDTLAGVLQAKDIPDIVMARGPSPGAITRAAVEGLGGMGRFVSRGDVVVIKPNIGWDRTPEYGANTNPEVTAALVRLCFEAGARTVKVFDYPVADPRRTYKQSGIADACRPLGAQVAFVDERKFKDVTLKGQVLKSWPLYTEALECDKLINVPVAKTHGIARLTLGMKNWMGIMGGYRGRIHQRIDECLVDVALYVRPALVVVDAVRIMVSNGPQGGSLSDVRRADTVIAGTDQVAVDACATTLFDMKPDALACVRIGQERGLGKMVLGSRVQVVKVP